MATFIEVDSVQMEDEDDLYICTTGNHAILVKFAEGKMTIANMGAHRDERQTVTVSSTDGTFTIE